MHTKSSISFLFLTMVLLVLVCFLLLERQLFQASFQHLSWICLFLGRNAISFLAFFSKFPKLNPLFLLFQKATILVTKSSCFGKKHRKEMEASSPSLSNFQVQKNQTIDKVKELERNVLTLQL